MRGRQRERKNKNHNTENVQSSIVGNDSSSCRRSRQQLMELVESSASHGLRPAFGEVNNLEAKTNTATNCWAYW